jgi:hypothetical protein
MGLALASKRRCVAAAAAWPPPPLLSLLCVPPTVRDDTPLFDLPQILIARHHGRKLVLLQETISLS